MKKIIFSVILILIFGLLVFNRLSSQVKNLESSTVIISNQEEKRIIVNVEIADTESKQIQGLSNHPPLKENEGMLFIFSRKGILNFWMKNMLFPLDMIWINDNRIIKIDHDLTPEGEHPAKNYSSEQPANFVLEVPAGFSEKNNVKEGDTVFYNY